MTTLQVFQVFACGFGCGGTLMWVAFIIFAAYLMTRKGSAWS